MNNSEPATNQTAQQNLENTDTGETVTSQAEKENPDIDPATLDPELLDRIKHPPAIQDAMHNLTPEELVGNPAVAPEMLQEGEDLRHDLKK